MFDPMRNILRPNEEVKVSCTFTPVKKREYQISLPLQVSSIYDVAKDKIGYYNPGSGANYKLSDALQRKSTKYEVCIVGAGSDGSVKISPTQLDFGTVTAGFTKVLSITIFNKSQCNINIDFQMAHKKKEGEDQELPAMSQLLKECFKFDFREGVVNAMSKKTVNITFKPSVRFTFDIKLVCNAKERMPKEVAATLRDKTFVQEKFFIGIRAVGDYPLLRFTDIRND
jgi:hypothetical protein